MGLNLEFKGLNHPTSDGGRIIIDFHPVIRKMTVGKGSVTVNQNYQKYLGFSNTEGLLCYSGINYNSMLILECCVGLR